MSQSSDIIAADVISQTVEWDNALDDLWSRTTPEGFINHLNAPLPVEQHRLLEKIKFINMKSGVPDISPPMVRLLMRWREAPLQERTKDYLNELCYRLSIMRAHTSSLSPAVGAPESSTSVTQETAVDTIPSDLLDNLNMDGAVNIMNPNISSIMNGLESDFNEVVEESEKVGKMLRAIIEAKGKKVAKSKGR